MGAGCVAGMFNVFVCLAFYAVKFGTETLLSSSNFLPSSPHGVCLFFFLLSSVPPSPLCQHPVFISHPLPVIFSRRVVAVMHFFFLRCFAVSPASLWPMLLYAYAI